MGMLWSYWCRIVRYCWVYNMHFYRCINFFGFCGISNYYVTLTCEMIILMMRI